MHSQLGSACAIHFELAHRARAIITDGLMAATMPNTILTGQQQATIAANKASALKKKADQQKKAATTAANKASALKKRADHQKNAAKDENKTIKRINAHSQTMLDGYL